MPATTKTANLFLATILGLVAATTGSPPVDRPTGDAEETAIPQGTWELTRPRSSSWKPRRFEVRTTTMLRDCGGTPVGDTLHGRISMVCDASGAKLLVERWGGNGGYVRCVFDGETVTWFVPSMQSFERSLPTPTGGIETETGTKPWSWLRSPRSVDRFGPATSHLFEVLHFDGFADFEVTGGPTPVDLGPVRGIGFAGRPADLDHPNTEPDAVHVALSDHPLGFPLAIATRLPDGRTLEFEYHDWAIETDEGTTGSFRYADPSRFDPTPPADWTEVMTIRLPGTDEAVRHITGAGFAGRSAAPVIVGADRETPFDAFENDGPVAVLFHDMHDEMSMANLIEATTGFDLTIRGVQVGGERRSGTHRVAPDHLERIWGFDRLPALVILDGDRTVLEARSPWYGPNGLPATDMPVATATGTED